MTIIISTDSSCSESNEIKFLLFLFQLKRERFVEELENYSKQVEEFQEYGNIKELTRYHKKAQYLEQKLSQAAERVYTYSIFSRKQ